jgi:hypothetical protein
LHQRTQNDFVVGVAGERLLGQRGGGAVVTCRDGGVDGQAVELGHRGCDSGAFGPNPPAVLVGEEFPERQVQRGIGGGPCCAEATLRQGTSGDGRQAPQLGDVQPVGDECIAGSGADDAIRSKHAPKPRDEYADLIDGTRRLIVAPQHVGDLVHRDRSAGGQGEDLQ